jgi:hypothetical protein
MTEKTKIILDIASNRIIFFTKDYSQKLELNEHVILYEFEGALPENLSLNNCWHFKFAVIMQYFYPTTLATNTDFADIYLALIGFMSLTICL